MKKAVLLLVLIFLSINEGVHAKNIVVPKDTAVTLGVKKVTTSKRIKSTYEIKAIIQEDLYINNQLIFRLGDKAVLRVKSYEKARFWGKGGKIVLSGGYAYDINKVKHQLALQAEYTGKDDKGIKRIIPFNKGEQAIILPSEELVGRVVHTFNFNDTVLINKDSKKNASQSSSKKTVVQVGIVNKSEQ